MKRGNLGTDILTGRVPCIVVTLSQAKELSEVGLEQVLPQSGLLTTCSWNCETINFIRTAPGNKYITSDGHCHF